jgi:hypothetical protein
MGEDDATRNKLLNISHDGQDSKASKQQQHMAIILPENYNAMHMRSRPVSATFTLVDLIKICQTFFFLFSFLEIAKQLGRDSS